MNFLRLFPLTNVVNTRHGFNLFLHSSASWQKLVQFNLTDIGEGIAEVELKEWHVKAGDEVSEFDKICDVQSDKARVTITSRYAGIIKKLHFNADDIAKVGQPLVDIEVHYQQEDSTNSSPISSMPQHDATPSESFLQFEKIRASPAVRKMIREHQIHPSRINATGPNGRILKEDLIRFIEENSRSTTTASQKEEAHFNQTKMQEKMSDDDSDMGEKIVPLRGHTRAMVKSMSEALEIPHFGYGDEVIADELMRAKQALEPIAERKSLKISYMPFIIKATSLALAEFPILNTSLDLNKQSLVFKKSHNISFAMDTSDGLVVPNIKNCQQKNIWQIAMELKELMQRGKDGRFTKEDLANGTFTLSNIGSIGGTFLSPVIFPPQVAIGAIGKIRKMPCVDENDDSRLMYHNVMNIFWAADHRVIDGATLARFSNRWKQFLETPMQMLAELR